MEQHYFSGQGKLFAGKRNRAGVVDSYYWVGNCTELLIETEQAYLDHKENYTGAKIIDLRVLTGSEVNVTITLENLKRENWATAYKGALALPIGATVTDETYLAPTEGNYLVLSKKNVTAVTAINPLAGGAAFSPVTDYQHLPPSNLVYVPTNSTMADTVVVVDYQSGASELMTAIGQPEEDLFLIFEGLNTVRDMERVVINLFRVRFSTTNQLQLISDELSRFQLIGKAIYDEFRADEGGYLTINYAKDFILSADAETVFNGDTFTVNFSAETPGTYPYTITGVTSADIGGASLTGTFTGGVDSVTFTADFNGIKTFNLSLDNGAGSVTIPFISCIPSSYEYSDPLSSFSNWALFSDNNGGGTGSVDIVINDSKWRVTTEYQSSSISQYWISNFSYTPQSLDEIISFAFTGMAQFISGTGNSGTQLCAFNIIQNGAVYPGGFFGVSSTSPSVISANYSLAQAGWTPLVGVPIYLGLGFGNSTGGQLSTNIVDYWDFACTVNISCA